MSNSFKNPKGKIEPKPANSLVFTIPKAIVKIGILVLKLLIAYFFLGSSKLGDERSQRFANWCATVPEKLANFWQQNTIFQIVTILAGVVILCFYFIYIVIKIKFSMSKVKKESNQAVKPIKVLAPKNDSLPYPKDKKHEC